MTTDDKDIDRALDRLVEHLPEELRKDWVVVPRRVLMQAQIAGLLIGAGIATMVIGWVYGLPELKWGFVVAVVPLFMANKALGWWRGDDLARQLRSRQPKKSDPTPPPQR